jgi:hypothetical protein
MPLPVRTTQPGGLHEKLRRGECPIGFKIAADLGNCPTTKVRRVCCYKTWSSDKLMICVPKLVRKELNK